MLDNKNNKIIKVMTEKETIKKLERIFKGLANRRRLAIIRILINEKELTVTDIAEEIKLSFKATSKHLQILLNLDILEKEQRSLNMYYRVSSSLDPILSKLIPFISNP